MKKYLFILILLFFTLNTIQAQKELWSVYNGQNASGLGTILKFDINGENPFIIHQFNTTNGRFPSSKLLQASNGKLYGTTLYGNIVGSQEFGVLYEYDLILDQYRVVHSFLAGSSSEPPTGVIEPLPGILYGGNGSSVYYYNIDTETLTYCTGITDNVRIYGELMKASNGNLYGTTIAATACQGNPPYYQQGTIFKVNLTTNISQIVYRLNCNTFDGSAPVGGLIEGLPGKLYGVTLGGGGFYNAGTLYELNTATNVFTKKITFDGNNLGENPFQLINKENGKLYGVCRFGGTAINEQGETRHDGTLYEYLPATNTLTKLKDFAENTLVTGNYFVSNPTSLLKTTNATYVGLTQPGFPFVYNTITNVATPTSAVSTNLYNKYATSPFIEICRKPSYHFFDVDTFDACVGSTFTYDIQNTNATSYQWLKNNVNVVGQTTGILNLTNLTANDAGNYTCNMTNECGTTTTMVLHLTVSCLGTNTVASLEKGITLYPNPAKNILNLKLPENIDVNVNSVTIANSLGQIVLIQKTENTTTIDVSNLQKGIYIISLSTNYGNWNGKFVKE